MRRRTAALASLAIAGLFLRVMERPRCKFIMTTFDPGITRAKQTRG